MNKLNSSRRDFLKKSAVATAGITIIPSFAVGGLGHRAPSDKLNIVGIGVGGKGHPNLVGMNTDNIVGLCDVDWKYATTCFKEFPKAKRYYDWRKMFDEMNGQFDAVMVATADHTHAAIAAHALTLGKHVYCQKPLTHSVYESRLLTKLAAKHKVATQMGNQGNSGDGVRQVCEWIWNGEIGEVREVHAWTDRPIWPQGLQRPIEKMTPPDTLNWDLFIGPAPMRPFHEIYTPWNWRGWWDFGTGALGDMGCHIIDPVFKALMLEYPTAVEASSTPFNMDSAPNAQFVRYDFPQRDNLPKVGMPQVTVHWYDGGLMPPRPAELAHGEQMGDNDGGCIFYGSKGKIMCGTYAQNPTLLPVSRMETFVQPNKTIRRISDAMNGGHEQDWIRACKESRETRLEASSNFNYAGPLNETVVMGVLAVRLQNLNYKLLWDGPNMRFTNISSSDKIRVIAKDEFEIQNGDPKFKKEYKTLPALAMAEEWIRHTYREGWEKI